MNKPLVSFSLVLPVLIVGIGHILANRAMVQSNSGIHQSTESISQVKLKTKQPQPFLISARDEETKECQWLGICKER